MNLLQETKRLCNQYDIKPVRSRGQNFLIKEDIYDKIIKSAGLKKDDVVLEVGPGLGFLTEKLAGEVKKVIAVELDDKETEFLRFFFKNRRNSVSIVSGDILDINFKELGLENNKFKIVANLPYNITSIFLRKVLSAEIKPSLMVLMLQKEVAERICAKPGKMSLLAVSVQYYAKPEIIQIVASNYFWPKPNVDSAIIKLEIEAKLLRFAKANRRSLASSKEFFRLVKIGFSSKRKMLKNNLANGYHISQEEAESRLQKAGFNIKIRAQELSVDDWAKLFKFFG